MSPPLKRAVEEDEIVELTPPLKRAKRSKCLFPVATAVPDQPVVPQPCLVEAAKVQFFKPIYVKVYYLFFVE